MPAIPPGRAALGRVLPRRHHVGPEGRNAGSTRERTIATAHCVLTSSESTDGPRAGRPIVLRQRSHRANRRGYLLQRFAVGAGRCDAGEKRHV